MARPNPPPVYDRRRCDACGMPNRLDRPPGREDTIGPKLKTLTIGGETVYTIDENRSTGCVFCGCGRHFTGGSLGDLA